MNSESSAWGDGVGLWAEGDQEQVEIGAQIFHGNAELEDKIAPEDQKQQGLEETQSQGCVLMGSRGESAGLGLLPSSTLHLRGAPAFLFSPCTCVLSSASSHLPVTVMEKD